MKILDGSVKAKKKKASGIYNCSCCLLLWWEIHSRRRRSQRKSENNKWKFPSSPCDEKFLIRNNKKHIVWGEKRKNFSPSLFSGNRPPKPPPLGKSRRRIVECQEKIYNNTEACRRSRKNFSLHSLIPIWAIINLWTFLVFLLIEEGGNAERSPYVLMCWVFNFIKRTEKRCT